MKQNEEDKQPPYWPTLVRGTPETDRLRKARAGVAVWEMHAGRLEKERNELLFHRQHMLAAAQAAGFDSVASALTEVALRSLAKPEAWVRRSGEKPFFAGSADNPKWSEKPWECVALSAEEAEQLVNGPLRHEFGICWVKLPAAVEQAQGAVKSETPSPVANSGVTSSFREDVTVDEHADDLRKFIASATVAEQPATPAAPTVDRLRRLVAEMRDALKANQVFHTPLELKKRGGQWNEFELDAVRRTRDALANATDS